MLHDGIGRTACLFFLKRWISQIIFCNKNLWDKTKSKTNSNEMFGIFPQKPYAAAAWVEKKKKIFSPPSLLIPFSKALFKKRFFHPLDYVCISLQYKCMRVWEKLNWEKLKRRTSDSWRSQEMRIRAEADSL